MIWIGFCGGLLVGLYLGVIQRWRFWQHLQKAMVRFDRPRDQSPNPRPTIADLWFLEQRLIGYLSQQAQNYTSKLQQLGDVNYLLESLPLAFLHVGADNHLLWCNGAVVDVLKVARPNTEEPMLLLELIRSYDLDELIEVTRNTHQSQEREWVVNSVRQDPANPLQHPPLYLRGRSFHLSGGEVGVFLENRYEFFTLTQQQNRWVSDVAHELKTPLTSVRLVAETLLNRVDPSLRSWMDRLLNEVLHLSNLVQDLLDLSHLEQRSSLPLTFASLDLVEMVYSAWETLMPLNRHKQTHLVYLGPDHCLMQGDTSRLYRMVLNLLDNAVKYTPPDHEIEVVISLEDSPTNAADPDLGTPQGGQRVILDVIDSGSGFSEAALPHVFDRFYRGDPSRTRSGFGHTPQSPSQYTLPYASSHSCGLGLAIVAQIVQAHQGEVQAQNHPRTGGAWIRVSLPLSTSAATPASVSSTTPEHDRQANPNPSPNDRPPDPSPDRPIPLA